MRRIIDPKTRQATAFYAALAVAVWDVIQRGLHVWNTVLIAALAGMGTLGGIAALQQLAERWSSGDPPPGDQGNGNQGA